jgi:hypothetical protein
VALAQNAAANVAHHAAREITCRLDRRLEQSKRSYQY